MSNTRTTRPAAAKKATAKRVAKKTVAAPEAPLSEQMQEEAKPARKPAGSPDLYPFMMLPARTKAKFFAAFGDMMERKDELPDAGDGDEQDTAASMRQAAAAYELFADIEETLRLAAADGDAYDAWIAKSDEFTVMELFSWYMERFQVGEAKASSSS